MNTGTDGLVRGASMKLKSGKLRCPIQLLYPWEIRSENERIAVDSHESPTVENADEVHRRPTQSRYLGIFIYLPHNYIT